MPMDMIVQGRSTSLFQASQQWSRMSSWHVKTRFDRQVSGLIHEQDGVGALCHGLRYLGQMHLHGGAVAERHDKAGALALFGTDGAEDVGRAGALVAGAEGPGAALGPAARDLVLLADASLVLEPDLYLGARRLAARDLRQQVGEVFLNASAACSLWA